MKPCLWEAVCSEHTPRSAVPLCIRALRKRGLHNEPHEPSCPLQGASPQTTPHDPGDRRCLHSLLNVRLLCQTPRIIFTLRTDLIKGTHFPLHVIEMKGCQNRANIRAIRHPSSMTGFQEPWNASEFETGRGWGKPPPKLCSVHFSFIEEKLPTGQIILTGDKSPDLTHSHKQ